MARKAKGSQDTNTVPKGVPAPVENNAKPIDRWKLEIELAQKAQHDFINRGRKVVKRYRDERDEVERENRKFNLLWSNVQTLSPALYSKPPKVQVARRFDDSDKVGRIASMILERGVDYELERYDIGACMRPCVQDRLLPGRGVGWVRYEPKITGTADAYEKQWECTPTDYVFWEDFLVSPARVWEEVRWVARRTFPSRQQLEERFGDQIGRAIPLTAKPSGIEENDRQKGKGKDLERAEIWEIWDAETETVRWIATGYDEFCDERPDPLKVEGFFPCPKPLFATMTNGTMVPVPDYAEYQDQAIELDDLTGRIASLTKALKVVGLYDKSIPQLQGLLNENTENQMVAVDSWAAFAEKGGIPGSVTFMPLKDVIETLQGLYVARQNVLSDVYQITGMADIVRGASNPNETATAQQIKGKYANLRLSDLQMDVERFARDLIRIKAEVMAEHYSPETLIAISGIMQAPEFATPPPEIANPPQPQVDPNAPPEQQQMAAQQAQMQQQQALQQWQQGQMQMLEEAIQLLKSPKFRDLRIDIETQSMVQMDEEAEKQSRTEFITAMASFLQQGSALLQVAPQAADMLGQFMLFAARGFRAGREMEATIERFVDSMNQSPPKQEDEGDAKAQAEQVRLMQEGFKAEGEKKAAEHQRAMLDKDSTIAEKDGEIVRLKIEKEAAELKALQREDGLHLKLVGEQAGRAQETISQGEKAGKELEVVNQKLAGQTKEADLAAILAEIRSTNEQQTQDLHSALAQMAQGIQQQIAVLRGPKKAIPGKDGRIAEFEYSDGSRARVERDPKTGRVAGVQ